MRRSTVALALLLAPAPAAGRHVIPGRPAMPVRALYPSGGAALAASAWGRLPGQRAARTVPPAVSAPLAPVRADPPSGADLAASPSAVRMVFSVPLDARFSSILVASDGMAVLCAGGTAAGAATELRAPCHAVLKPGPYTVVYTAVAARDTRRVLRQCYLFTVGPTGPPLLPDHRVDMVQRAGALTVGLSAPSDRVAHQTYALSISAAGRPVRGAAVTVVGRALDMDMGASPATVRATAPGRYRVVDDVVMAGPWQMSVTIRRGAATVRLVFTYVAHY